MKRKTIKTTLEGYLYLMHQHREQRGFDFTEKLIEHYKYEFGKHSENGKIEIIDRMIGGGIGSRDMATWTDWSVSQMAEMLTKQGIPFEYGTAEIIYL